MNDELTLHHGPASPLQSTMNVRHLVVSIFLCGWLVGCAGFRGVEPGQVPAALEPGEGLVLLHLDTEVELESLMVTEVGGSTFRVGGPFAPGRHLWIAVAPAGRYRFDRVERRHHLDTLKHEPPPEVARFDVVPGEINYPGMINVDKGHGLGGHFHYLWIQVVNRSSLVIPELERAYPGLHAAYAVRFAGTGRDLSLEKIRAARAGQPNATTVSVSGPPPAAPVLIP